MNDRALNAAKGRDDFSDVLVHLTRDDLEDENGATAVDNFQNMLAVNQITALRAHCLHGKRLWKLDKKQQQAFKVTCFTETTLDQIDKMVRFSDKRGHNFKPYGFVFTKDFMLAHGVEKATYINGYSDVSGRRRGYDRIFETAVKSGARGESWRTLPFVNVMHDGYDFAWEREWRIAGDLNFDLEDLVCVILPENDHAKLRREMHLAGVGVISPGWTYGQMVAGLCKQKRLTRGLTRITMMKKKLNKS